MSRERPPTGTTRGRDRSLAAITDRLVGSVRAAAFWLAVVLPLAYLPVLATFEGGTADFLLVGGLGALHVFALSLGHDHRRG